MSEKPEEVKKDEPDLASFMRPQCPCCLQEIPEKLMEPTAAQKEAFLMYMLGDVPYSRVFNLMDGNLRITITDKTPEATAGNALIVEQLMKAQMALPEMTSRALTISGMVTLVTMVHCIAITAGGQSKTFDNSTGSEWVMEQAKELLVFDFSDKDKVADLKEIIDRLYCALDNRINSVVHVPRVMLNTCISQFIRTRDTLIGACYGADFYTGAGL